MLSLLKCQITPKSMERMKKCDRERGYSLRIEKRSNYTSEVGKKLTGLCGHLIKNHITGLVPQFKKNTEKKINNKQKTPNYVNLDRSTYHQCRKLHWCSEVLHFFIFSLRDSVSA